MEDQVNDQIDQIQETVGNLSGDLIRYAIIAVVILVVLFILRKWMKRRPKGKGKAGVDPKLIVDLTALGTAAPPAGPTLLFENVPVRLAAVVLAPAGRVVDLPPSNQLAPFFDAVIPGLSQIVSAHQPKLFRWPTQMASTGFAHALFRHAQLPGGGHGSRWNTAAGVARLQGRQFMAGLILQSADPNNLGQTIIEVEAQWLKCLQIK